MPSARPPAISRIIRARSTGLPMSSCRPSTTATVYVLLTTIAILETSSLSPKTALAAGLLTLAAVLVLPQLSWVVLTMLVLATVILPLLFPMPLDAEATCWQAFGLARPGNLALCRRAH